MSVSIVLSSKFFELLQFALHRRREFTLPPEGKDWIVLLELCRRHTLTGIGYSGVEEAVRQKACAPPPLELTGAWKLLVKKVEEENRRQRHDVSVLTEIFRKEGFSACILKGQALARLYEQPERREPGDIDVWVWPSGGETLTLAERRKKVAAYCNAQIAVRQEVVYHHMAFPVRGKDIEVHFTPSWMSAPWQNRRLQHFFDEEMSHRTTYHCGEDGRETFHVPSLALDRVFVLVHIYRHLFAEGIGLRQLLDYDRVLQATTDDGERCRTMALLDTLGMRRFTAAMMWVLHEVFGLDEAKMLCQPDAQRGQRLLHEVMAAGNFGKYDERGTVSHDYGSASRFGQILRRNLRFLADYPIEVLCMPCWKLWHQWASRRWSPEHAVRR